MNMREEKTPLKVNKEIDAKLLNTVPSNRALSRVVEFSVSSGIGQFDIVNRRNASPSLHMLIDPQVVDEHDYDLPLIKRNASGVNISEGHGLR